MSDLQIRLRVDEIEDVYVAQEVSEGQADLAIETYSGPPSGGVGPQIEPVTAILIGAGALAVAKFVLEWWEKRRGGLVLDQRADRTDDIYRDKDVPYGYIVIWPAAGGVVKVETKDAPKDGTHQLLEAIVSGVFKSATDIAKAATEILGEGSVKSTTDA